MPKKILLSPHLDDAVFDCWYLLTQPDATLLTIFSGVPAEGTTAWWDGICGQSDSHRMMQIRVAENKKAIEISGNANPQLFLDLLDNQYRAKDDNPTASDLADAIERITPKGITYYAPLAISCVYRHPDHVLARETCLELHKRGHHVGFFPDYPYMRSPRKPRGGRLQHTGALAERVLGMDISVQINDLTPDQLKAKSSAIKAYRTQYTPINIETFGALSRLRRRNYELLFIPT